MRRTIEQYHLLSQEEERTVIVALSGGADSTALLWGLSLLGYRCVAAHCNFHLRGAESDRDELFAQQLCDELGVSLERASFDTYTYAAEHRGMSIEMAARELRYRFFDELYERHDAACIALGHHLEDNVEQLLINLSQGAGIRGLRGMRPSRDGGRYIRPLIDTPPALIHDFLQTAGQNFVTDSTNADTAIRRNFVRHTIRPLFDQLNPSFDRAVASTIEILRDLEEIQEQYLQKILPPREPLRLEIAWLRQQTAPRTLLYHYFASIDCDRQVLQQILLDCTQAERAEQYACYEGRGGIIERYRGYLIGTTSEQLRRLNESVACCATLPPVESWAEGAMLTHPLGRFDISLHKASDTLCPAPKASTPYSYLADYDQLLAATPQLEIRACADGSRRVAPLGLKGTKQMTKLLRDAKLLPSRREATPQLVDSRTGEILWVVGVCRSAEYQVTPQTLRWVEITYTHTLPEPLERLTEPCALVR